MALSTACSRAFSLSTRSACSRTWGRSSSAPSADADSARRPRLDSVTRLGQSRRNDVRVWGGDHWDRGHAMQVALTRPWAAKGELAALEEVLTSGWLTQG